MRNSLVLVMMMLFAGICLAASTPSWVQPGVTANYEVVSSFYEDGKPVENGGAQGTVAITVNGVSGNTVTGTATVAIPAALRTDQYPLNCVEGSKCDWRFWVDPSDPTNSATGPNGEKLEILGRGPFEYYGGKTDDATMIGYSNEQTGASYRYTFDSRTGLVYAYVEDFPTQKTYMYYRSINVDLSSYQPPAGVPQPSGQTSVPAIGQQTIPGQQTPAAGQQGAAGAGTQPTGAQGPQDAGTSQQTQPGQTQTQPAAQGGSVCSPALVMLIIAGFACIRGAR
ncbi:Uncharacterised protein [Candidatus Burarchaeum australiense]|nr:Uncharacterised protein [Candidatus Burarchaeum australiense]